MLRRSAFVSQQGPKDCWGAALATLVRHYRIPIGLRPVRALVDAGPGTPDLQRLLQVAESLRFLAKIVQGPFDSLLLLPLPALAEVWTEDWKTHCVVLCKARKHAVVVADPARGFH